MTHIQYLVVVLVLVASTSASVAYERTTHRELSTAAAQSSALQTDQYILSNLGLKSSDKFRNSKNQERSIFGLIEDGADFEDAHTRSLNHFYDPLRNRGLFGVNIASPDWALEDAQDADNQEFSYKDARDYLYQALTSSTEAARKQFFGKTFQTLGQVIHHLQDMAQPQHVRNDAHCDAIFPCLIPGGLFGLYSPSLYEEYTNYHRGKLLYTGYDPVTFPTARGFWTGNGAGIADYTNHNFLSAGTNFDTRHYPNPFFSPATEREENANNLMANAGVPIPPECLPPNDPCVMTFYGNLVQDRYRPAESRDNPRASTWSLFDQDLKVHNKTITRTDPDTGQTYTSNQAFSLNRFNFDEAHTFLIPRAVAYSAGLIDYFFRGRLEGEDVEFSDNGVSLRVKNAVDVQTTPAWSGEVLYASTASGVGTLIVSYDYKDAVGTTRYGASPPVNMIAGDHIGPGQVSKSVYSFAVSIPQGAMEVRYRLVFRGRLGQEDNAVAVGMIEPISGFLITPNYLPADGIAGRRLLYNVGGSWKLSDKTGVVAGNVDWKGWYVNGRATRVLSWVAPGRRYLPSNSGVFDRNIFQHGEMWAVAPYPVLGAALRREGPGAEWIVAVCQFGPGDIVLRKRNKKDMSGAFFDPSSAPDGWEVIGRFPAENGRLAPDRSWLFNGDGSEAQTMRRNSTSNSNSMTRLKITITGSTVQLTDLGNLGGIGYTATTDATSTDEPPLGGCVVGRTGTNIRTITRRVVLSGEYIVAVDYKDAVEVLVKVRGTGEEVDSENISHPWSTPICTPNSLPKWADAEHKFGATSTIATVLEIENLRVVLLGHYGSIQGGIVYAGDTYYQRSGSTASSTSSEIVALTDLDARHGLYKGLRLTGEDSRSVSVDTGQICISPTKSETVNKDVVFYGSELAADTVTYPPFLGGCRTRGYQDSQPIVSSLNSWLPFYDTPRPPVLSTYLDKGSLAVDTTGNLFVSGTTVNSSKAFRYFSGGDLSIIVPSLPANSIFHPIGLVR